MDFKEQVRAAADIVQVIGEVVKLKPAGPNRYKGLCPFHGEKTPSFHVDRGKQFFYCFGCQKGGDVFRFLMEIEGVGFFDALNELAGRFGVPIPKRSDYSDASSRERDALLEMHRVACDYFRSSLNADARRYLSVRHVTPEATEEFGLGYAPSGSGLAQRLQRSGHAIPSILASGLVLQRDDGSLYDRFRNRLMFPIHSESGQAIAFGGRALGEDEPKYLNSPETGLYTKKRILYNLHRAKETIRRSDLTILVEGYMDVIGVAQAGVKNVVASCGTALSEEHVRAIRRHSDRIVVNFDPDAAGTNAAERSIQMLLEESMKIRVLQLDGGLDPDEYVAQKGAEAYRKRAESAESYFHWLAERARAKFDMKSASGRMEGFRVLLKPALERIPDKLERLATVNDLAMHLGVDARAILDQFKGAASPRGSVARSTTPAITANEQILVRGLLDNPALAPVVAERLRRLDGWHNLTAHTILESALQVIEADPAGRRLSYDELEARLNEADRKLLAAIVFTDKTDESVSAEQLQACLDSLESAEAAQRRAEIRKRVKILEREGRMDEAMRLLREAQPGGNRASNA